MKTSGVNEKFQEQNNLYATDTSFARVWWKLDFTPSLIQNKISMH